MTSSAGSRLALVEEVPDALQVARIAVARHAEVDVQELAAARTELAGRRVTDLFLRPRVDGGAMVAPPRVAEAAPRDLVVHQRCDLRAR